MTDLEFLASFTGYASKTLVSFEDRTRLYQLAGFTDHGGISRQPTLLHADSLHNNTLVKARARLSPADRARYDRLVAIAKVTRKLTV